MYSLILWALAAFFTAVMDTDQFHYGTSIFTRFKAKYWDRNISWQNKKILGTAIDAWHGAKFLQLACFMASVFTAKLNLSIWLLVLIYSITWYVVFGLFWDKIFIIRK